MSCFFPKPFKLHISHEVNVSLASFNLVALPFCSMSLGVFKVPPSGFISWSVRWRPQRWRVTSWLQEQLNQCLLSLVMLNVKHHMDFFFTVSLTRRWASCEQTLHLWPEAQPGGVLCNGRRTIVTLGAWVPWLFGVIDTGHDRPPATLSPRDLPRADTLVLPFVLTDTLWNAVFGQFAARVQGHTSFSKNFTASF